MRYTANIEELSKTSFIKCESIDERRIPLFSCYNDDEEWELWFPGPDGLVRMRPGEPVEAAYFSKDPVNDDDVYFRFFNLFFKHAYYPDMAAFIKGVLDDILNLAACLRKLEILHQCRKDGKTGVSRRIISTEIEFVFITCRSTFDLLQEIIQRLWKRFKYIDENKEKKELPQRFAKVVIYDNALIGSEEIANRYNLPPELARFYHRQEHFFEWLKEYRDYIAHSGKSFDLVFIINEGFAVKTKQPPFSSLDIWNENNTIPNDLGSVKSVVAHLILSTLNTLDDFTHTISQIVEFPADIAPDYNIFICGRDTKLLRESRKYIDEDAWYS